MSSCKVCTRFQRSRTREPLLNHDIPDIPFYKVGADIAYFAGKNYLVVVDYYSRWIEVLELLNKTSAEIINKMRNIFSRFGIPALLIADNNPFNSYEFSSFLKEWNITLYTSSPHHHQSNGLAEKAVGTVKKMLKKSAETNQNFELYMLNYRNAPVAGFEYSPSQLLMNRTLRSKLPIPIKKLKHEIVSSNIMYKMQKSKKSQENYYNKKCSKLLEFIGGEKVWLQNIVSHLWEPAIIVKKLNDPRSYLVRTRHNKILRRNSIYLKKYF